MTVHAFDGGHWEYIAQTFGEEVHRGDAAEPSDEINMSISGDVIDGDFYFSPPL